MVISVHGFQKFLFPFKKKRHLCIEKYVFSLSFFLFFFSFPISIKSFCIKQSENMQESRNKNIMNSHVSTSSLF